MSTPQTIINICAGVRLDNRYNHTIYFSSVDAQLEYFAGKVVNTFPAYSYHRRNWELKVEARMDSAQKWNYLYTQNPGEKPTFYFINKVEYVNETTVKLYLEMDVIQTNLFEIKSGLMPCFVERQHTESDSVGEHTVPEGLELGPYFNYHVYDMEDIADMGMILLSAIDLKNGTGTISKPDVYNGVYSGMSVFAFQDSWVADLVFEDLAEKLDAIVSIWMYPKKLISLKRGYSGTDVYRWEDFPFPDTAPDTITEVYNHTAYVAGADSDPVTLALYSNYSDRIFQGFKPRNKKLYTAPYNLLYVTNNQGGKAEYKFEHFNTEEGVYNFQLFGAISPDAGVKIAPVAYNAPGYNSNYDEGLVLSNYPQCAWNSDTYKVWLAQNFNQLKHAEDTARNSAMIGVGMAIAGAVATVATGGLGAVAGVGAIGAGISSMHNAQTQIGAIMAQKEDAKAQPPQARGNFSSTVNVASGRQTFTFYYKSIQSEYARQIDDYFTMYGYQLNRVQVPNLNARPAFTYIKTLGCNVSGHMGNEDIVTIERIFDKGITFWRNGDKIGDYSQDNQA
jgi:hypothetical protein